MGNSGWLGSIVLQRWFWCLEFLQSWLLPKPRSRPLYHLVPIYRFPVRPGSVLKLHNCSWRPGEPDESGPILATQWPRTRRVRRSMASCSEPCGAVWWTCWELSRDALATCPVSCCQDIPGWKGLELGSPAEGRQAIERYMLFAVFTIDVHTYTISICHSNIFFIWMYIYTLWLFNIAMV